MAIQHYGRIILSDGFNIKKAIEVILKLGFSSNSNNDRNK